MGQILTTVGEKLIPALIVESSDQEKSSEELAVKSKSKGLHLLQVLKKDVDGIAKKWHNLRYRKRCFKCVLDQSKY